MTTDKIIGWILYNSQTGWMVRSYSRFTDKLSEATLFDNVMDASDFHYNYLHNNSDKEKFKLTPLYIKV